MEQCYQTLSELDQIVAACTKCPLHAGRIQAVPGAGNAQADILFVGEAPGKNEDEQGVPFVGAAGRILDEMLQSIGLKREDIYIANIIKCRPPGNRDPLPAEIAACVPYLKEQILLIQPKVIVTLGRFSMNLFLSEAKIGQVHGQLQKVNNLHILPLYHPAVALYNGGMKATLLQDFQILSSLL